MEGLLSRIVVFANLNWQQERQNMRRELPFPRATAESIHIDSLRRIGFVYGAIAAAVFSIASVVVLSQPLYDKPTGYAAVSLSGAVR